MWLKKADSFDAKKTKVADSLNSIKEKVNDLIKAMEEHNKMINALGDPFATWGNEFITDLGKLEETQDEIIESIAKVLSLEESEKEPEEEIKADVFHETGIIPWVTPSTQEK